MAWKPVQKEFVAVYTALGDGINTAVPPFDIRDTEGMYLRDVGSQDYPALSPRYGRTFYSTAMPTITSPLAIGERNNQQLHVVDGNSWKVWSTNSTGGFTTLTTTLTGTDAEIQDFATGTARYTVLMNSTQKLIWDGTSTALVLGDANTPFTKLFTVHKSRIYAARDNDIMYSALSKTTDWTTANDAGSIDVTGAKGPITGIVAYNGYVTAFTEYGMHELHGESPSNFSLVDIEGEVGCFSNRSITKLNDKLYWYGHSGIFEFAGGKPQKISDPVKDYIDSIDYQYRAKVVGGSYKDLLYMAIPNNGSTYNNLLLVFDTRASIRKWYIETGNFVDFKKIGNNLYGINSTGGVLKMRDDDASNDNGTAISWEFITKPYIEGTGFTEETLNELSVLYSGTTDCTLNISYSTEATDNNSTSFNSLASSSDFTFDGKPRVKRVQISPILLQKIPYYRLKFNGTGRIKLYRLSKEYRVS